MEKILIDIALILVTTKIGGILSRKLNMPEVLGALLAGVIIGPAVFNLVHYNESIKLLSNLGVIFLMFLAGLETDVEKFKKAGKTSFIIALFGIIIPLILGTLVAYLFFNNSIQNIFIGIILTATSVSITVETLTELGKLNTKAGINILGAAIIDDIICFILISLFFATQTQNSNHSFSYTIIRLFIFCVFIVLLIIFLPKLVNKLKKHLKLNFTLLAFSIAAILAIAFISEIFGISAVIGGYICGIIFSQIEFKKYIEKNIKPISSSFLSPIFFASVGLVVTFNGFNLKIFLITFILFIVSVIDKVIGCAGAAKLLKMNTSESLQIGVGMVSRGEVAIITANIGLQNNIIEQEIFIPIIFVILLTTIVTPILLKVVFKHKNEMFINKL